MTDVKELCDACEAKGYDPIKMSGLAFILKVCEVVRFKYYGCTQWQYELRYRGHRAHENSETKVYQMRNYGRTNRTGNSSTRTR